VGHGPLGLAAAVRRQAVPVERVVPDLGRVVEHLRVLAGRRADDVLEGHRLELGSGDRGVQLVDVGLVMLAVMELQRLLGQVGLKGVDRVGQRRQRDHVVSSIMALPDRTRSSFHGATSRASVSTTSSTSKYIYCIYSIYCINMTSFPNRFEAAGTGGS